MCECAFLPGPKFFLRRGYVRYLQAMRLTQLPLVSRRKQWVPSRPTEQTKEPGCDRKQGPRGLPSRDPHYIPQAPTPPDSPPGSCRNRSGREGGPENVSRPRSNLDIWSGWWIAAARLPLQKDIWVNKAINLQPTQGQGQDRGDSVHWTPRVGPANGTGVGGNLLG